MCTMRWRSGNASVCKTDMRGFDSRPHLKYMINLYGRNVIVEAILARPNSIGNVFLTYESHKHLKELFESKTEAQRQSFNNLKFKIEDCSLIGKLHIDIKISSNCLYLNFFPFGPPN